MNVEEKVKSIVEKISGLNYNFNDWTRANVELDYERLPICLYILPPSGTLLFKNGNIRDYPSTIIAFLDKADFDFDSTENEVTVERMKFFAKQFVVGLNSSGLFQPLPENITYQAIYDKLDVNLTGVAISVELKEINGICIENIMNKNKC